MSDAISIVVDPSEHLFVVLGGHVHVGDGSYIGGGAAVHQTIRIGRLAMVSGLAGVTNDIPPFGYVFGLPARLVGFNRIGLLRRGATRDQLRTLLARANQVTTVLADRDTELQKLFKDGGLLLDELNARRDAIHNLLINTTALSLQLQGLVKDNTKTIGPLLDQLSSILTLLNKNEATLDRGLALLGPFYRVFNNTIGNGRWFDNYICNFSVAGVLSLGATSESPSGTGACS